MFEQIKHPTHTNTREEPVNNLNYADPGKLTEEAAKLNTIIKQLEEPLENNLNYPDPVKLTQEIAKLNIIIKEVESEENTSDTALFASHSRSMRTVDD